MDAIWEKRRNNVPILGKLGPIDQNKLQHILDRTDIDATNPWNTCWMWKGYVSDTTKGHSHPNISYKNKYVKVHRLLYHNFIEDVPEYTWKSDQKQVNHKCSHENNGLCINPWHFYLGTPKENMQDAIRDNTKNKPPCGEQNWNASLADIVVAEVKALKGNTKLRQKDIAKLYGVSQSQISRWWNDVTRKS